MLRSHLLALAILAVPSAGAAQYSVSRPTFYQLDAMIARLDHLAQRAQAGDLIISSRLSGKREPVALTRAELEALITQLVMADELAPSEVAQFIRNLRAESAIALENLMVRRLRLERDRLARAGEEGANPYARPSEIIRRGTFPGSRGRGPSDPYLQPYDDMIVATASLIERGRAGDFILEHQVDGRRVPVAVTKAQMEQVVVELVMLGELEPADVAAFVEAARIYSGNALDGLRTRHEILTSKRDRMASGGQEEEVPLAGIGDALIGLGDPLDIGPIAARAAERVRATAVEGSSAVAFMPSPVRMAPPPPPVPPPPPSGPVLDWSGTYVDSQNEYIVSGGGASLAAEGRTVRGNKGTGRWSDCAVVGNKALCAFSGTYEDVDKSATFTGIADLTLGPDGISGSHRLIGVNVAWRSAPYNTAFHQGAVFPFTLTRKR